MEAGQGLQNVNEKNPVQIATAEDRVYGRRKKKKESLKAYP